VSNIQCSRTVVVIKNGRLIKNRASETARFKMYKFVTVFIFANRKTTNMTKAFPISPAIQMMVYDETRNAVIAVLSTLS
jgi:hypothetical protein